MKPTYNIFQGDAAELLNSKLSNTVVHCVVTSPPYFNQRKYGNLKTEIGLETDVELYIETLVSIFESINLHPRGSIWVNIGDKRLDGALQNIPARFVESMRKVGFRLIDSVIWAKLIDNVDGTTIGNCMTEPCKGRLNERAYEPLYRFTKNKNAWSDSTAVQILRDNVDDIRYLPDDLMNCRTSLTGRNLHNVWNIGMGQTTHKHYAVYPVELCERPIAMCCPPFVENDVLFEREVEWIEYEEGKGTKRVFGKSDEIPIMKKKLIELQEIIPQTETLIQEETELEKLIKKLEEKKGRQDTGRQYVPRRPKHNGWNNSFTIKTTPGIVLDPFCGTGTSGEVALKLGRSFIGIELYKEYAAIAQTRCDNAFGYVERTYGYDKLYSRIWHGR